MKRKKINIVTLGCAKNIVDSEHLAGQLGEQWEVVYDSDQTDAKVVIINTCGFIGDAKEESINTILRFAAAREAGDIDHLFVMGCLSERYRDELREEIPEVDEFFGVNNLEEILRTVGERYRDELRGERRLTTPRHYAYLKISEGCNWGCGYCAIPLIRGKHLSVPFEDILAEAETLAARGVKELMVIAQDTTYYGMDLYGHRRLGELLRALCRIEGIEWIRLHYAYPAHFPQDVIEAMRDEPKICKYLDIPLQHISDRMLRSMRRGLDKAETETLIATLRREIPDIALRTTLLVGYPGETEADFQELLDFVAATRFDRLGVFPYSEEEGTYSATELTDDVPAEVKEARAEAVMSLQRDISRDSNQRLVESLQRVIVDRREGDFWVGRTQYDSPEVDQEVFFPATMELTPGDFVTVRIAAADDYDLQGEVVTAEA
ncbi:MAG TPA: 30S ribosomal protein S12 methylthiotransferase RimO [Candidatus Rikenella faecigallinarum]|uniref:Ribosomal protein uS12 methylthiotransferase RimO n=1 Tax=Candidatus Rikenella faecigallinarum TaxID=2838745 RepID=A0A9D1QE17_9BACT|nr:30S ribosomal protein S12 methylthiotransferase RimO [Candidatus Rikenella faecigallinarum]